MLFRSYAKINKEPIGFHVKKALWLIIYLLFIATFGYLGSSDFGGINFISSKIDHVLLAIISLIFFVWGTKVSYKTSNYFKFIDKIE